MPSRSRLGLALFPLFVAGCSLVYKASDHQGGDAGEDGQGDGATQDGALCDGDGDQHTAITCGGDDCDDTAATIHPGAEDICGDGIDQTCAGQTTLSLAVGRDSALTFFPSRLLFSYDPPRMSISGTPSFVAPLSIASTPQNGGWFVVSGVERTNSTNVPIILGASASNPTSYAQIGNRIASPPTFDAIIGAAVRRHGNGGPDFELSVVRETPNAGAANALVWNGEIEVFEHDLGITSLTSVAGLASFTVRPGAIMTGGDTVPRWVIGVSDSVGPPPSDSLISIEGTAMASLTSVSSTLITQSLDVRSQMSGTNSGQVFFRRNDGDLGIWSMAMGTAQTIDPASIVLEAQNVSARPALARLRVSGTLAAGVHDYVMALPYTAAGGVPRLALAPVTCGSSNGAATTCTTSAGITLSPPVGEQFYGSVGIVALERDRIMLLAGTTDTVEPFNGHLRMFVGSYTAADGPMFTYTTELDTFDMATRVLDDIAVGFVSTNATPATVSILWQIRGPEIVLRSAGARFCNVQ